MRASRAHPGKASRAHAGKGIGFTPGRELSSVVPRKLVRKLKVEAEVIQYQLGLENGEHQSSSFFRDE